MKTNVAVVRCLDTLAEDRVARIGMFLFTTAINAVKNLKRSTRWTVKTSAKSA